ncbi:MAG: DUF1837 domain-containing protein [Kordiimonadaceae bacterium]|nr:DUF1837 domain-containing protein [Kordiimonadaceae bacterium]MBO6568574.1 DUF1837 domain-containing protein [Kordiimonadaceae bacterium]MBO6963697.1 DUF1837 domain-containing protein [Kordiimonadaceae bacterium]
MLNSPLPPLLPNHDEIKQVLPALTVPVTLANGEKVDVELMYLPFNDDDKPDLESFFACVKDSLLARFALTLQEMGELADDAGFDANENLFEIAANCLSTHTAQGELGELILFIILDVYFNAPKLFSKVAQKQNRRMPVFGADGVHGRLDDGRLTLYIGEAKLWEDYNGAASDAVKSIATVAENFGTEFRLIRRNISLENVDEEACKTLLAAYNPFKKKSAVDDTIAPCFIGFSAESLFDADYDQDEFIQAYLKLAEKHACSLYQKATAESIKTDRLRVLLLPFVSVEDVVQQFIDYMGIVA